ncbi:uncharacterized protein ACIQIH_012011 [Cyanocitta cristata]
MLGGGGGANCCSAPRRPGARGGHQGAPPPAPSPGRPPAPGPHSAAAATAPPPPPPPLPYLAAARPPARPALLPRRHRRATAGAAAAQLTAAAGARRCRAPLRPTARGGSEGGQGLHRPARAHRSAPRPAPRPRRVGRAPVPPPPPRGGPALAAAPWGGTGRSAVLPVGRGHAQPGAAPRVPGRAQRSSAPAPVPLLPPAHTSTDRQLAGGGPRNSLPQVGIKTDRAFSCVMEPQSCVKGSVSSGAAPGSTGTLKTTTSPKRARKRTEWRVDSALVGHRLPDGLPTMPSDSFEVFSAASSTPDGARSTPRLLTSYRSISWLSPVHYFLYPAALASVQPFPPCRGYTRPTSPGSREPGAAGRLRLALTNHSTTDDTDLAEPKLSWRHLLLSCLSSVFKCHWSKGEKERGTACNSSRLLRDGPSPARPSSLAPHPMGLPTLCPLAISTRKAVKQGSRKNRRRKRGTGKAGTGPAPKAAPRCDTGPAAALSVPLLLHPGSTPSLPSLQTAASVNEHCSLISSSSEQQSQVGASFAQERITQTTTERAAHAPLMS